MNHRERFIKALKREPYVGRVPHFELEFFLTMESIGKVHYSQRHFRQWNQMSKAEKNLHLNYNVDTIIEIVKRYHHSAIFLHPNPSDIDNQIRQLELVREKTGDEYFIMMHGDCTFAIPNGEHMMEFTADMYENPNKLKEKATRRLNDCLERARKIVDRSPKLLDGFALCSDYCFNTNPFFTLEQFDEFIKPYLKELIQGYHSMGLYTIKHTDGNILPLMDAILDCKPDAIHSLDPQAGISLKDIKKNYGDRVCLIGNVNCGLLDTGTDDEIIKDVRRSLKDGMPGYGYIFSTSNCVYTGLNLKRYEMMNNIWFNEGIYSE